MSNEYKVPTVKIKWDTEGGHMVINEKDFDPSVHQLWEPPAVSTDETVVEVSPPPVV